MALARQQKQCSAGNFSTNFCFLEGKLFLLPCGALHNFFGPFLHPTHLFPIMSSINHFSAQFIFLTAVKKRHSFWAKVWNFIRNYISVISNNIHICNVCKDWRKLFKVNFVPKISMSRPEAAHLVVGRFPPALVTPSHNPPNNKVSLCIETPPSQTFKHLQCLQLLKMI